MLEKSRVGGKMFGKYTKLLELVDENKRVVCRMRIPMKASSEQVLRQMKIATAVLGGDMVN